MNRKYYYIAFKNGKYRIFKEFISEIQTDSIYRTYNIYFINGVVRKNNQVYEQRRKARQVRDALNRCLKWQPIAKELIFEELGGSNE